MKNIHSHKILILDFGSQYTQLIGRRVREAGVYCEIQPYSIDESAILKFQPKGIILSGSPESVNEADIDFRAPECVFSLGIPVLGICYGMHTMALQLGGAVEASSLREFGYAQVAVLEQSQLFDQSVLDVWMSHGDHVTKLASGFKTIASTDNAPIACMADESRQFYGVQFHPEVTHTVEGAAILQNFIHKICACESLWLAANIVDDSIEQIRHQVGTDQVLLGLSGGVDSSVVAALLHRAIGKQLTCVFVDNGLLRLNEGDQVMATFAEHLGVRVIR
ncbi:glutamine-hydrolyzing GMP synthase, partial [Candidatus Marithrix sp. Canyon 246]